MGKTKEELQVRNREIQDRMAELNDKAFAVAIPFGGKHIGELAEWSNAAVLKTVDLNGSGGSNPSLSAQKRLTGNCEPFSFIVSPKISQKCIKYCESTARNSKELQYALII